MLPLQSRHTFALPVMAQNIIEIFKAEQLTKIDFNLPFIILGEGSNTVFLDDYSGLVISMKNNGIEKKEDDEFIYLKVAAGENWHQLVCSTLADGILGLENLALIPGSVGAAPVQNIGAYGVEVNQFIEYVKGYDITQKRFDTLTNAQCLFSYRDSIFKGTLNKKFVITEVAFKFNKSWQPALSYGPLKQVQLTGNNKVDAKQIFNQVVAIREEKLPDPKKIPNAGSFFKNPVICESQLHVLLEQYPEMPHYPVSLNPNGIDEFKLAAGWLIDQADLKGFKIGGIEVNPKQALVLLNHGDSSGADITKMILTIQKTILTKFSIMLEHEVRIINIDGECKISLSNKDKV
ncbi:UDP-N-acetylmuramate dehydrogenase [Pseudoalteromonas denitrificans]|uniref:UDP-N-acetylenolpyruvoylglucosamine reductase n=1 Tax=Pseudoalteromonas denitrificans DSM 6059 TaxID=1123010 RepID=A0A1I1S6T7_9GAMM|nr:UDP-N-acetylmuramate dehydrogenase [Pseudoalteromonas denitrificans]SFD42087.1 UDP-N-acetylmuramate dehydrogenase [Pseudoalteromonas denitrificans DSM 6059]